MEILGAIAEVLFSVLPERIAAAICTAFSAIVGIVGIVWFNHERHVIALCNSAPGRFGQLMNGSAVADCGIASLLKWAALIVALGAWFFALCFAGLLAYIVTHPDKKVADMF